MSSHRVAEGVSHALDGELTSEDGDSSIQSGKSSQSSRRSSFSFLLMRSLSSRGAIESDGNSVCSTKQKSEALMPSGSLRGTRSNIIPPTSVIAVPATMTQVGRSSPRLYSQLTDDDDDDNSITFGSSNTAGIVDSAYFHPRDDPSDSDHDSIPELAAFAFEHEESSISSQDSDEEESEEESGRFLLPNQYHSLASARPPTIDRCNTLGGAGLGGGPACDVVWVKSTEGNCHLELDLSDHACKAVTKDDLEILKPPPSLLPSLLPPATVPEEPELPPNSPRKRRPRPPSSRRKKDAASAETKHVKADRGSSPPPRRRKPPKSPRRTDLRRRRASQLPMRKSLAEVVQHKQVASRCA